MSTTPLDLVIHEDDDTSQVSTPVLTQMPSSPVRAAFPSPDESVADQGQQESTSLLSPNSSHLRLPIPTPSANRSQSSFAFVDVHEEDNSGDFDDLPEEVASADISIAPDGSFVETSSANAARELKKRYDRLLGVGKSVRSPYAITAFVNQHGKQMFRVGHRDQSAPAAAGAEVEQRATMHLEQSAQQQQQDTYKKSTHSSRSSRRSRMSMHTFLPPSMFPITTVRQAEAPPRLPALDGPRSPARKLRKARSNPQLSGETSSPAPSQSAATVGRGHSQSVTAADMPRLPVVIVEEKSLPRGDLFSSTMHWSQVPPSPLSSSSMSYSSRSLHSQESPTIIVNPFGARVTFDSPSRPSEPHFNPPLLREMQSFESGLTARADGPIRVRNSILSPMSFFSPPSPQPPPEPAADAPPAQEEPESTPSTPSPPPPAPFLLRAYPEDRSYLPTVETSLHTRYSVEVFDVLQTYRGLPLLDRLSPDSTETTVIKMSLNADDTAAPRDDPRFVIWGEVYPEPDEPPASAPTDPASSSRSHASRRRSTNGKESLLEDNPPRVRPPLLTPEKVLVAATIERWIAQLTSELNYDELLVFFLTYRTYITAVDLCHLLICRFHWALGKHTSDHDEMVRRIVRVRTFVAIRYWLLTFFVVDFVPNRELRLLLASWLNSIRRDPILLKHNDATSIVRKLASVVRECKEVHSQRGRPSVSLDTSGKAPIADGVPRKSLAASDSDLDLDFIAEENAATLVGTGGFYGAATTGVVTGVDGNKVASLAVLQQPLHKAIMEHRPSISTTSPSAPIMQTPATLPVHHSALSRAIVNTIGRLGRWKRVLNSRSTTVHTPLGACADVSAFDLELNATGDLLTVRGGVEQYLKMIEQPTVSPPPLPQSNFPPSEPDLVDIPAPGPSTPPLATVDEGADGDVPDIEEELRSVDDTAVVSEEISEVEHQPPPVTSPQPVQISLRSISRSRSSSGSSGSSSSYGVPISSQLPQASHFHPRRATQERSWQLDVVSIDDLELSDTSSNGSGGPAQPPGLKKPPRRLPLRRDFEFVDRPRDSVSSMGLSNHESTMSGRSSAVSSVSAGGLGGPIQQWQMNALVDSLSDEEETGDVEDALKRLEGQMNPQVQRAKESKVDNWVKIIRERLEAGDYGNEAPRYPSDEESAASDVDRPSSIVWSHQDDTSSAASASRRSSQASARLIVSIDGQTSDNTTPVVSQTPHAPAASVTGSTSTTDSKPAVEDVVPVEILQSRVNGPATPAPSSPTSPQNPPMILSPPISKFVNPKYPRVHRSWILGHGTSELAQHFSMIDRELFLGIKFEELVSDDWISSVDEANILDWGLFLKDRARWKAEGRGGYKTSALIAARGRFNLIANFVVSEIVLTYPAERPALVGKFVRIAWKCFHLNNFSTLVAIIAGLRSEWVTSVMRKSWTRVNLFNLRMLEDLTAFTKSDNDFAHIRNAVAALSDATPGGASEEAASVRSSMKGKVSSEAKPTPPAPCIPFIGIYLSQLHRFSNLPDLIDPTAPNEGVGIDSSTGNFNAPAHPEVFATLAPLPPAMQLEPLINVHKQRLIAGAIKQLVAGQHLASRVQFPVDRKLFQRCLKLRGLDADTLQRAAAMYPD